MSASIARKVQSTPSSPATSSSAARNASSATKKNLLRKVEAVEKRLAQLNAEKIRHAALLSSDGFYTVNASEDRDKVQAAVFEAARVDGALQQAEGEWLVLHEELEKTGAGTGTDPDL